MKTLALITDKNYVYNHLVYDNATDKHFAKHSHALYEIIYILIRYTLQDIMLRSSLTIMLQDMKNTQKKKDTHGRHVS